MAKFGQAFINQLTSPGYGQGLFNLGSAIGSAPAVAAAKQKQGAAMQLVNDALASNDSTKLLEASQMMKTINPDLSVKLAQAAGLANKTRQETQMKNLEEGGKDITIQAQKTRAIQVARQLGDVKAIPALTSGSLSGADYLRSLATANKSDKGASFGTDIQVRDANGNIYTATSVRNKDTGRVETAYSPITPNAPITPEGGVAIISGTTGAGAFDKPGIEGDVAQSKAFSDIQVQAATELPNLIAERQNIDDAISALGSINTGGIPANVENFIRKNTGVQDPNAADYEVLVGEAMFQRLKPLFGGVISEGEREAVMSLYANLKRGNPANKRILQRMAGFVNDAITRSNLLRNSASFDEYNMKLDKFFPEGSSFEEAPENKEAPAPVGRWNSETGRVEFYNAPAN